ncbi:hypothetical protein D3C76_1395820 [compost metagenome]
MRLLGLQRALRLGQHLLQPRAGICGNHGGQRPFNQRRRTQPDFGGQRRIQQIDGSFSAQQRAAQVHQHHNARALSHRLYRLHHLDRIGAYRVLRIIDTRCQRQLAAVATHHLQCQFLNAASQLRTV